MKNIKKALMLLLFLPIIFSGCDNRAYNEGSLAASGFSGEISQETAGGSTKETVGDEAGEEDEEATGENEEAAGENEGIAEDIPDEDGIYDSRDDVCMYLLTYHKLPSNYMTKKEARKLGWEGGSLEKYAAGRCIGGDRFGNNEVLLPEDSEYHECDIDTLGAKNRGAKRIVYSDDFKIYYTEDHYETFELIGE